MDNDVRWKQRFQNYERAYLRLKEGTETYSTAPNNLLMQAGLIQMFEFTFELALKLLKDYLEEEGFLVQSPKSVIRQAYQSGYICDGEVWMQALNDRNLTSHTYDDENAIAVIDDIREKYLYIFESLYLDFKDKL